MTFSDILYQKSLLEKLIITKQVPLFISLQPAFIGINITRTILPISIKCHSIKDVYVWKQYQDLSM